MTAEGRQAEAEWRKNTEAKGEKDKDIKKQKKEVKTKEKEGEITEKNPKPTEKQKEKKWKKLPSP